MAWTGIILDLLNVFFVQNVSKTKKDSFTSGTNKLVSLKKFFSKEMKKYVFDAGTNEYP